MMFQQAVSQLAMMFATFTAIIDRSHVLVLRYEDQFSSDRETLVLLARHLGISVACLTIDTLFSIFRSENVRDEIAKWKQDAKSANTVTHWVANHVGDGLIGKWRGRLSEAQVRAVLWKCFRAILLTTNGRNSLFIGQVFYSTSQINGSQLRRELYPSREAKRCLFMDRICVCQLGVRLFCPTLNQPRWQILLPLGSISMSICPIAVCCNIVQSLCQQSMPKKWLSSSTTSVI